MDFHRVVAVIRAKMRKKPNCYPRSTLSAVIIISVKRRNLAIVAQK